VEMGFNAAAGEMDEQRRHEHLHDGDGEAGEATAGSDTGENEGQQGNCAAIQDGHGQVVGIGISSPGMGADPKYPKGNGDGGGPLNEHEPGELAVDAGAEEGMLAAQLCFDGGGMIAGRRVLATVDRWRRRWGFLLRGQEKARRFLCRSRGGRWHWSAHPVEPDRQARFTSP
jgi:hypothetical protein